jgi:hypothetical protein
VICVFGIFFVPDLHGAVRGLWRLVRPAGFLAIPIWGAKMFEPADDKFWEAVRQADPELLKSIKPWNKIVEPDPLRALLVECGVTDPVVVAEPGTYPLNTPEDCWMIILGSGYRSTVDALSPADRERVRVATVEAVKREKIRGIGSDVVYAIARRSTEQRRIVSWGGLVMVHAGSPFKIVADGMPEFEPESHRVFPASRDHHRFALYFVQRHRVHRELVWPVRGSPRGRPVRASQSRTVLSSPPETTTVPPNLPTKLRAW